MALPVLQTRTTTPSYVLANANVDCFDVRVSHSTSSLLHARACSCCAWQVCHSTHTACWSIRRNTRKLREVSSRINSRVRRANCDSRNSNWLHVIYMAPMYVPSYAPGGSRTPTHPVWIKLQLDRHIQPGIITIVSGGSSCRGTNIHVSTTWTWIHVVLPTSVCQPHE